MAFEARHVSMTRTWSPAGSGLHHSRRAARVVCNIIPGCRWACSDLQIIDLELYTIWTDGFQLLALALLLLAMADAVPLPDWLPNITPNDASASKAKKQYARAAVLITIFHHVTTGIGAYQHWAKPSHHTVAMDIGVYGNVFFTVLGAMALLFGLSGEPGGAVAKKHV